MPRWQQPSPHRPQSPARRRLWDFVHWPDGRPKYHYRPFFLTAKNILRPLPGNAQPTPPAPPVRKIDRDNTPLALYAASPMKWPEQFHLFRQLNYRRWRIDQGLAASNGPPSRAMMADYQAALEVRRILIESNLRIVRGMTRTITAPDRSILISDAMTILVRAVDLFDPWWGVVFSTYAGASIKRSCWRWSSQLSRLAEVPMGDHDPVDGHRPGEELESTEFSTVAGDAVRQAISRLPEQRMREIIQFRHGIGCERRTLSELGRQFGLSKERIRQIETRASDLLRKALAEFAS